MINVLVLIYIMYIFAISNFGKNKFSPLRVWLFSWMISWVFNAALGYDYYFSGSIIFLNVAGISAYTLGAFFYWNFRKEQDAKIDVELFSDAIASHKYLPSFTTAFLTSAFVFIDLGMRKFSSANLIQFLTYDRSRLFSVMKENQAALYENNELNFPAEFKIVTLILCFSAIVCLYSLASKNIKKHNIFNVILLFVVSLVFSAASNVRSLLLVPIIIGAFSFYTGCVVNNRTHVLTSKWMITSLLTTIIGFAGWVIVVQSARMGDVDFSRLGEILNHMRPWVAGYIPALSVWFDEWNDQTISWGANLLRAVLGPLGVVEGEGFDSRTLAVPIGNWQTSNAMTFFRVLILDFGPAGAVAFCYVMGFFGEYVYSKAKSRGGGWVVLLIAYYCTVFFSINYWFFAYGARVFGFIFTFFIFSRIARNARKKNGKKWNETRDVIDPASGAVASRKQ